MLNELLWRCPLCTAEASIRHTRRFVGPDRVTCLQCGARWRMRRQMGDNFYLKLLANPGQNGNLFPGEERSLPAWYDAMKASIKLTPLDSSSAYTQEGEVVYVRANQVQIVAEETDNRFFHEQTPLNYNLQKEHIRGVPLGPGQLLLTNQRLLWLDSSGKNSAAHPVSIPIREILYASTFFGLVLNVGLRMYMVYFSPPESMLKWITYLDLVSQQLGHKIKTSPH